MTIIAWLLAVSGVAFGLFTISSGSSGRTRRSTQSTTRWSRAPAGRHGAADDRCRPCANRAIRPMVIWLLAIGVAAMALALTPDPFILPVLILIGALWWLAPSRDGAIPEGRASVAMGTLVLAGAVLLVPYAMERGSAAHGSLERSRRLLPLGGDVVHRRGDRRRRARRRPAPRCVPDGDVVRRPDTGDSARHRSCSRTTHPRLYHRGAGRRSSADWRSSLWVKWKRVARTEVELLAGLGGIDRAEKRLGTARLRRSNSPHPMWNASERAKSNECRNGDERHDAQHLDQDVH